MPGSDEGVGDELVDRSQRGAAGDRVHGIELETSAKDRGRSQHVLGVAGQQAPRPIEHRPHAAVALRQVRCRALEYAKIHAQSASNFLRGNRSRPGSGELESQRKTLNEPRDSYDRIEVEGPC